jgi:hypothetical protein
LANAGETTEHLREDTVVVPDPADRATIEEEHALELRTRDRERKLLKKIEQSIQRIDAVTTAIAMKRASPLGWVVCWLDLLPICLWKRSNAANSNKKCLATNLVFLKLPKGSTRSLFFIRQNKVTCLKNYLKRMSNFFHN